MPHTDEQAITFGPGPGVLVCSRFGFLYLSNNHVRLVDLEPLLALSDRRAFFLRCVAVWSNSPEPSDFFAGVFAEPVTVMASGRSSYVVTTTNNTFTVEPATSNLIVERTCEGSFVSAGTLTDHEFEGFVADRGILPVGGFTISGAPDPKNQVIDLTVSEPSVHIDDQPNSERSGDDRDDALLRYGEMTIDPGELTVRTDDATTYAASSVQVMALPETESAGEVLGAYCTRGHFTDSRKISCLFCDAEVEFGNFGLAPRPSLGLLEFNTGEVLELSEHIIIGRRPERLRSSTDASSVLVPFADDKMLSRTHVEVRLVDWDVMVVDHQSANGTIIVHPDGRSVPARPLFETVIEPHTTVQFGEHSFVFRRDR